MIRSNRFISNISLFATIFFFIFTVSLGLVFYYMNKSSPVIWLIGTLFIGMFLAFLTGISNLNKLLVYGMKSKSDNFYTHLNKNTTLTSCPDYWTRNVAYNYDSNSTTTLCYNKLPNSIDEELLGGELIKQTDSEGNVSFVFSENSYFPGKTLDEVRDLAKFPKKVNFENFVASRKNTFRRGDPEYQKYYHKHSDVQHIMSGKISTSPFSKNNVDSSHTHNYYFRPTGHSHTSAVSGADDIMEYSQRQYEETYENLSNWISPYELPDGRYAVEINMDILNKAENACELSKYFIWSNANYLCIRPDN